MPRNSNMPSKPIPEQPNYIRPEDEKKFVGSGEGDQYANFIPDADWINKQKYQISKEQEAYGLQWKPGDPEIPPAKARKGGLNPISGDWETPEEIAAKKSAKKGRK